MHNERKKRQHFVWRKYLRRWAENDSIYCLMNGKIFKSGLMGVGQERYFYKLKELTKEEVQCIKEFINQDNRPLIRQLNHGWIEFFNKIFEIKNFLKDSKISNSKADEMLDVLIHNFEEDFHGKIESDSIKFLEYMYNKNLSFYNDDAELIEFLFFICQQYFRTQNMDNRARKTIGLFKGFNVEAMWAVLRHISVTSVGCSLYQDRSKYRPVLLENVSTFPFVTGDQPVINTHAVGLKPGVAPNELEFYYPLTPTLALLLTDNTELTDQAVVSLSEADIIKYNKCIYSQSGMQIYSSDKASLEFLLNGG